MKNLSDLPQDKQDKIRRAMGLKGQKSLVGDETFRFNYKTHDVPLRTNWRQESQCFDCPFAPSGLGAELRQEQGKGWLEVLKLLRSGGTFFCHHFGDEEIACAGGIEWQDAEYIATDYTQKHREMEGNGGKLFV